LPLNRCQPLNCSL